MDRNAADYDRQSGPDIDDETEPYWSAMQVRQFAKELRADWGGGWKFFDDSVRRAIVDSKVLTVARSQNDGNIDTAALNELVASLRQAMGVSR